MGRKIESEPAMGRKIESEREARRYLRKPSEKKPTQSPVVCVRGAEEAHA